MKATKIHSLHALLNLVLIVLLLQGCQSNKPGKEESAKGSNKESQAKVPEMDLHTAVLYNDVEVIRQHIAAGSDIDAKDPFSGSTPLISAATFDRREIASLLIEAGADLNLANNDGSTPLHTAAFFCRTEILQLLLDARADKNIKNNFGATARESVLGSFDEMKPFYELMQQQLAPMGLQLDLVRIEKTRPVVAMMLQ
ncbi:MAG: ankyrin repeat domain-containing protein [Bacteroidales bacterium]